MSNINWFLVLLVIQGYNAVNVEQVQLLYFNEKYVKSAFMNLTRFGPGGLNWHVTMAGETIHQWGNNITIHFQFLQYVNNEFRPSFIDVRFKLCDFINKEPYFGEAVRKAGFVCPCPPGVYKLTNLTLKTAFKDWPFEKNRLNVEISVTGSKEVITTFFLIASFIMEKKKRP